MSNPLASLKKAKKPPLLLPEMSKTPTPTPSNQNPYSSRLSPLNKEADSLQSPPSNISSPFTSISSLNSAYAQSTTPRSKYWTNSYQTLPNTSLLG